MKNNLLITLLLLFTSGVSVAQITGVKTIPGDYATISAAIADLNSQGTADTGVTFKISAGYIETLSTATAGHITTQSGSLTSPIVFEKAGSGVNPLITAPAGTGSLDAMFAISGCDYVTFDGIDLQENASNANNNTRMEWGYAILKVSTANGSQHITIRNCNVSLNQANTASVGIYSNNHLTTSTTQLAIVSTEGANSYLKIYGNTVKNCYIGIYVGGYNHTSAPYEFFDQNNEIGKDGANAVSNFGGSTVAMSGIYTIYQNNLTVANNLISGTCAGSGACQGIQLGSSGNGTLVMYNNTVSLTYSGTGSFYGIYDNMGTSNTNTNSVSVYNNTVTNCTVTSPTSGNCYFINISHGGPNCTFHDNLVTNCYYGTGTTTATGSVYYIYLNANPTTNGTTDVYNNTVSNCGRSQSTSGGGVNYILYQNWRGETSNTYNNHASNVTFTSTGGGYGYYLLNGSVTKNFYGNTLSGINNSNGNTGGFYNGNGNALNFYNNVFRDITVNSATSILYGLNFSSLSSSGGNVYIYNNFFSDFKTPNSSSLTPTLYGLYLNGQSVNTMGLYNNTVFLNATSTGANFSSADVYLYSYAANYDFRNNIFINLSNPAGLGISAVLRNGTSGPVSLSNYSSPSNNNNFYAGTPSSNRVIYYDGSYYDQTLAEFKARVQPNESNSISENTNFVNSLTAPYDLHIDATIPAQVESSGTVISTPIAITADFEGDARYPNTGYPENAGYPPVAPDMGADEFGGIPSDVTGPSIYYTPFAFTAYPGVRTLTATITDFSGVPTSGIGLPRICWKKNSAGTWAYETGTSIGSSQYTFDFGAGTVTGDTVYYFIVAQDQFSTPAVGVFPSVGAGGFSANPPICAVPPLVPSSFYFADSLCGTYTVGVGQDFTTLTEAIQAYNTREITCPVFFELTDELYTSETVPINILRNPGTSTLNTLTIRPANGNVAALGGYSADAIFKLVGAQNIVIDGSKSGANDRSLTLANISTTSTLSSVITLTNDGTYGASNIVLKNLNLQATNSTIYAKYCILMDNAAGSGGYNNVVIDNNLLSTCKFGMYIGGSNSNYATNVQITNNSIGTNSDATSIWKRGIEIQNVNNLLIENNDIQGKPSGDNSPQGACGVYITGGNNIRVLKNIIHDWYNPGTGNGLGGIGIVYSPDLNSTGEISNNVIYNIKFGGYGSAPYLGAQGISISANTSNLKVFNNSVHLQGNYLVTTSAGQASVCLSIGNGCTNMDIRNNILQNSSQPIIGSQPSYSYGVYLGTGFTGILDKNDYFSDGIGPMIGYMGTTQYSTLAAWQAASGQDANSVSIDPVFVSATDLHQTNPAIAKLGDYIPALPTDIEGNYHTNPSDLGAYQVSAPHSVSTTSPSYAGLDVTLNGTVNANGTLVLTGFEYGTTLAYGTYVVAEPDTVTGTSPVAIATTLTGMPTNVVYYYRAVGVSGSLTIYGDAQSFIILTSGDVIFNVDMSTAAGFTPGTDLVYLAGNFPGMTWNEPGTNPALQLSQVGSTLTYTLTLNLPFGTYEYKYFKNTGWGGGEWNGGSNRSAVITAPLTINDTWGGAINWANLQWPGNGAINTGGAFDVYAQAYIPNGITGAAGVTNGLQAWIGYSTTDTDPSTWTNWIPAPFSGQSFDNDEFKADLGATITSAGTYYYASRFQYGNMPYVYGGFSGGFWDGINNVSGVLTVTDSYRTLNLNLFLEGLYAGNGVMNKAQNENGDQFPGSTADQISIELHDATDYNVVHYTVSNVNLDTLGSAVISNIPATFGGNYYITVKHRNSIETVTSQAVSFASGTISYAFDFANKAYGDNMLVIGEDAMIFGGDVNQDGIIDSSDMIEVDNEVAAFTAGYVDTDVNGDGLVDSSDMILIDNNASSFVSKATP